jgi:hypothetical protein
MVQWARHLPNNIDLALGLALSVVLGSVVGLAVSHSLGHLILGSALGVIFLLTYMASYSLGTQQGLIVVSVFVWCAILSAWLSPTPEMASAVRLFRPQRMGGRLVGILRHALMEGVRLFS